jgi:hypothetical protein
MPPPVLFVRLPRFLREETRMKRYCEPLDEMLRARGLGSAQGDAPSPRDGSGFSGCAVFSGNVDAALEMMGPKLKQLEVPKGTVVEELCTGVGSVHSLR